MKYIALSQCSQFSQGKQVAIGEQFTERTTGFTRFIRIVDFTSNDEPPRYVKSMSGVFNVEEDDLIMIRYGSQTAGKVVRGFSGIIANNMFKIDIDKQLFDKNFAFYYLSSPIVRNTLVNMQSSSTMPAITFGMLENIKLPLHPLKNQKKIGDFLKNIDKKIETNTAINNNLEQQAQALFQQYFGSKSPNGNINDILDEMPKSKIKVGDAKDVRGPYPFFTSGQNILEYTEALVDGRNIFLNTGGNADVKYYIGPAAYSTDTWCIKAKNNMTDMLYLLLKGMQTELDSIYFEGSALRHLQKPKLKSLAIYIPTDEELKTFNSIVASLFNKIAANVSENKILEHTRDALLPKLMNGEIDVSKVDISDPGCLDKSLFNCVEG